MEEGETLQSQIEANWIDVQKEPKFDADYIYLTFCLFGMPSKLKQLTEILKDKNWQNIVDWDTGTIYPKIRVGKHLDDVIKAAEEAQKLFIQYEAHIIHVDADTDADVWVSTFVELYNLVS